MRDPKPLKELLNEWELQGWGMEAPSGEEMYRRLRALDEEIREVAEVEHGHGIRHPFIFTERIRAILDGRS